MSTFRLDKLRLKAFCEKHHIIYLSVFGSALTSYFGPTSDVDILVQFDRKYLPTLFEMTDLETELTSLVGRTVDLKTPNDLSPYFREEVLRNAEIYYSL